MATVEEETQIVNAGHAWGHYRELLSESKTDQAAQAYEAFQFIMWDIGLEYTVAEDDHREAEALPLGQERTDTYGPAITVINTLLGTAF